MKIKSLLVANRGEIACRIFRTCKKLGIRTIAVYSEADKNAIHVEMADEAFCIGGSAPAESYLNIVSILHAAKLAKADAIHPGYGFLSEKPEFADECAKAGIIFVGPTGDSMRAMGLKDEAKRLMRKANVPVVNGYEGEDQSIETLQNAANSIGYPILIKAIAGGGGRGMRPVFAENEFAEQLKSAQREAITSFGDDRVLLETYVQKPRHVEIQIMADSFGNTLALFERDCSIQRRHQKVIEEAPAPDMPESMRKAMSEAAIAAAKAVNYQNAGTVEFLVDASAGLNADKFYFMEMNTRLQVEHPVTEEITGLDLVEMQLKVASGEKLPIRQSDLKINGHAMEVRVNAEDAASGFLPSSGMLHAFEIPHGGAVRVDTGFAAGRVVPAHYDSMIAKVIVHGKTRELVIAQMIQTLESTKIAGVTTNIPAVLEILKNKAFQIGDVDTKLLPQLLPEIEAKLQQIPDAIIALGAQTLLQGQTIQTCTSFSNMGAFQLSGARTLNYSVLCNLQVFEAKVEYGANGIPVSLEDTGTSAREAHEVRRQGLFKQKWLSRTFIHDNYMNTIVNDCAPCETSASIFAANSAYVFQNGACFQVQSPSVSQGSAAMQNAEGALRAPMPGRILALHVKNDQQVEAGQPILVLEAMKMEHVLRAPFAGIVSNLNANLGDLADMGAVLAVIEAA